MKYYKNYILKVLSQHQIDEYKYICINAKPLIIPYEFNKFFYCYRIN